MDFKRKYKESDSQELSDNDLAKMRYPGPCRVCGTQTRFYHTVFKQYLCSEECQEALYKLPFVKIQKKHYAVFGLPHIRSIFPERCLVNQGDGTALNAWAIGTERLERFYVVYDDGTDDVKPIQDVYFISKEPHIDINRYR